MNILLSEGDTCLVDSNVKYRTTIQFNCNDQLKPGELKEISTNITVKQCNNLLKFESLEGKNKFITNFSLQKRKLLPSMGLFYE